MSQVSKNKISQKVYEKIFFLFPKFLYKMTSSGKQSELIESFFTRTEKIVLAKRVAIAFLLVKGYSYRNISSTIKVSTSSILKIADCISNNQIITKQLEQMALEDSFIEFLNELGYQSTKILPPKTGNWSVWRRRIEIEHHHAKNPF